MAPAAGCDDEPELSGFRGRSGYHVHSGHREPELEQWQGVHHCWGDRAAVYPSGHRGAQYKLL